MNEEDGILVDEYLTTGGFITMVEEDEDGNFVEIDNEKQDDNNSNKAIATQPEELPKEFICPFVPTSTGRIIRFLEKVSIKENDIVVLFLGRLSFHAKAHYMPMYIALENVKMNLPKNVNLHLIQTGWFPNKSIEELYVNDAKEVCPSVICHFLDGRNYDDKIVSYSSSDIFISMVDNFQETFGLTPLEGMASGLPAIVSDWNGYKGTVRDNLDGFRIETVTMKEGGGYDLALRQNLGLDTYDHYIGRASQSVSINIEECIERIKILAKNKELRNKMGKSAKKQAEKFKIHILFLVVIQHLRFLIILK